MPSDYQNFIFYRSYSRWNDSLGRRETWEETVDRYVNYMRSKLSGKLSEVDYSEIRSAVLNQEVMPSMRLMWGAGPAVDRSNVVAYNCSYIAPQEFKDFGEILYILTCGSGVGFTVEKKSVERLPVISRQTNNTLPNTHIVADSKEGWAEALVLGMETWYEGRDIKFDYSLVRPAGARLKVMGGRASGPEPLKGLLDFTRKIILGAQGRKLRPIEVHDIVCKIGDIVVSGGVRRSSEISLSDLDDTEMRGAKSGTFWIDNPHRTMANNSAVYLEKPTREVFEAEWEALKTSGTGERGIFNRGSLQEQMPERRKEVEFMGTNPCGEITLRPKQFCNLTEIVARPNDTKESLIRKARIAAIMGTFQASLTNFGYLSESWKKNCEEEALLGVSITGQFDCPVVRSKGVLEALKLTAIETNALYAGIIGINPSASVTCVKPSGTVSQLVDAASGMHPRFAPYFIRRVRISATDPLFTMLKDSGVPYKPETGQLEESASTYVLEFPVKAPDCAITADQVTALDQLEHWKLVKQSFTEHNPSNTIYVSNEEWDIVRDWLYENWDSIGGLSFLPKDDNVYLLAPYEAITKEKYEELAAKFPAIDYSKLSLYEMDDFTEGSKALACMSGVCEIA